MRHNRGIVYAVLLTLAAMLFAAPILQSVLGSLDGVADLYAGTDQDPRPLIYSFSGIPKWVSIASFLVTLVLCPTLGLFVTLVTRPRNWMNAVLNGALVGGVSVLMMALLLGWAPFMVMSQSSTNDAVRLLAGHVWPTDSMGKAEIEQALVDTYPKLLETPDNQKINYLSSRIFADGVAAGPRILFAVLVVGLVLALLIVIGAVVEQILLTRGHRWWFFVPRYLMGWFCATSAIVLVSYFSGGANINGKELAELKIWVQLLVLITPALLCWMVLRRWRKTKPHPV